MEMNRNATLRLAYGGVLAAMIALLTAFVRLPVVMLKGYAHLGDVGILLSSLILGPFAAVPAAGGSALADLLAGYAMYAPFTLLIKGPMGFFLGKWIARKRLSARSVILTALVALFMVGGYFLADMLLYGLEAAIASVVGNAVQGGALVAGGLVLLPLYCSLPQSIQRRFLK